MSQTKITVKIYEPLLRSFDRQLDVHFKRDAFLNRMIQGEVKHLADDLDGKRLSLRAKRYISGELKRMGTTSVNIVVDKSTADALGAVVEATNMVRDAFINRLIILLRSSKPILDYLELPAFVTDRAFKASVDPMPTSPLKAIESVLADPMFYLRVAAEERHGVGLYLIDLPAKLDGFACYLDDARVPGTEAHAKSLLETQAMLDELGNFEADAFQKPAPDAGVKS